MNGFSRSSQNGGTGFGISHLSTSPVVLWYGVVILAALGALCVLRHLFGAIKIG